MSKARNYELVEIEIILGGVLIKTHDDEVQMKMTAPDALDFAHALLGAALESIQVTNAAVVDALEERKKKKLQVVQ